jgi:hypothetical protein
MPGLVQAGHSFFLQRAAWRNGCGLGAAAVYDSSHPE